MTVHPVSVIGGRARPPGVWARLGAVLRRDSTAGALLVTAAVAASVWANSPAAATYERIRDVPLGPAWAGLDLPLHAWAADGLLALFFFIVGNELKQEFAHGAFRDPRQALVPMVAALTGALVPALLFVAFTVGHDDSVRGWGIPMATDAAFAVPVLALVGRHIPAALRTILLTLAVVDDVVAIIVIGVFYTSGLNMAALSAAGVLLGVFAWLQYGRGLPGWLPAAVVYVPLAVTIWALVHAAGMHATIAGVAMGVLMRTTARPPESVDPSGAAERRLRPWAMGVALPVFALLAAGVSFAGIGGALSDRVTLGVIVGLVAGKFLGVLGGAWLTTRLTRARLDPGLSWADIVGMSQLAGIGFTVSLLISELSYPDSPGTLDHAKAGVLLGTLISTALATLVLGYRSRHYRRKSAAPNN
ncbi:Na+/H+ antiporter NhaA [Nocardia sp. BMG51109]|uniref:Na+/H+ antiporter NhaA n=1 Tax=Nocardia sp. BMG51109 TaxID=1056816 RepID=UPI0004666750|nr:Na+/H+ antiporter NhaA [Nocardia sp. BMG51109]